MHDAIAVFELFPGLPRVGKAEGVSFRVAEDKETSRIQQRRQAGIVQKFLSVGCGTAADVFFAIRRVGEDEIKLLLVGSELTNRGEHILNPDLNRGGGEAGDFDVLSKDVGMTR